MGLLAAENFDTITANSQPLPVENVYDWGSNEDLLVEDPLSPDFSQLLATTARNNTQVFWDIFRALPSDNGFNFPENGTDCSEIGPGLRSLCDEYDG
jgi:phospholipase D1/2